MKKNNASLKVKNDKKKKRIFEGRNDKKNMQVRGWK